jgi:hypothetical protein
MLPKINSVCCLVDYLLLVYLVMKWLDVGVRVVDLVLWFIR